MKPYVIDHKINFSSMTKQIIIFIISSTLAIVSFGQFSFKDDNTDNRIQSGAMEEIDKKFSLQKDNDFELRLFIFPKSSDKKGELSIFILSAKNREWKTRLFENAWSPLNSQEIPLRTIGIDSLWKELYKNDVLTIPLAQEIVDQKGEILIDQLEGDNNSLLYSFEFLTKNAVRHYAYKCPLEFSKKYDFIPTFKKVSNIVQLILNFCQLGNKLAC
jgi:hypothetical protein